MTDLCHHFVVLVALLNIFYNHDNPLGLKIQHLIRINMIWL